MICLKYMMSRLTLFRIINIFALILVFYHKLIYLTRSSFFFDTYLTRSSLSSFCNYSLSYSFMSNSFFKKSIFSMFLLFLTHLNLFYMKSLFG